MAKRRGRKSAAEARIERLTWFALVMVFAVLSMLPDNSVPNMVVPFSGAVILLGSGIYQYSRRWHVSPITWIGGSIMLVMGAYNYQINPDVNMTGFALLIFAGVILFGILTNET